MFKLCLIFTVYQYIYHYYNINDLISLTEFESYSGDKLKLKQTILEGATLTLCANLQLGDVLVKLKACGAITGEHMANIEHRVTPMQKMDELIDCLRRSSNTRYFKFMAVLEKEHKDVYNEVMKIQSKKINGSYHLSFQLPSSHS